jgi:cytochrome b561
MIGLSVLALVLVRLAVRLVRGGPDAADGTPLRLALARHWGHVVLYALLVLIPLGGAAAWFLGLGEAGEIHGLVANLLMILAGGHAALALSHQYARHDGTLIRMLRP